MPSSRLSRKAIPMGNVVLKIPLVTWRDGRPRFFPGPSAKALGYRGEDLRHGKSGAWFTLEECIAWSTARQAEMAGKRAAIAAGDTTERRTANATRRARDGRVTISQVMHAFLDSPRMKGEAIVAGRKHRRPLSPASQRMYRGAARCLENFEDGQWWHEPADELTGPVLDGLLDALEQVHGLAMARHVRAVVSVAFGAAKGKLVQHNPAQETSATLPVLPPRVRPATVAEFDCLLATADALGLHDFGDLVCAGAWTAQRQNDRLALTADRLSADGILFTPNKKKASAEKLLVPLAAQLRGRLEASAARRRAWKVQPGPRANVFLRENGSPWQPDWYRKVFQQVRHVAAYGAIERDKEGNPSREAQILFAARDVAAELARAGVTPLASLADLRDQDLRDTGLSWAQRAGCDKWEIAGLSGHAFGKDDGVLKHYVSVPPEFARRAVAKVETWVAAQRGEITRKVEG